MKTEITGILEIGDIKNGRAIGYADSGRHIWHACKKCGKERWVRLASKSIKPTYPYCWRCAQPSRTGEDSPNWKGGRHINGHGYPQIRLLPNDFFFPMASNWGYISEHRLVMAKSLGRCLLPKEIVHHLNGIRNDNRPQNLTILYRNNHPHNTFVKECQKRIRQLEAQLAQHKLL